MQYACRLEQGKVRVIKGSSLHHLAAQAGLWSPGSCTPTQYTHLDQGTSSLHLMLRNVDLIVLPNCLITCSLMTMTTLKTKMMMMKLRSFWPPLWSRPSAPSSLSLRRTSAAQQVAWYLWLKHTFKKKWWLWLRHLAVKEVKNSTDREFLRTD